MIVSKIKALAKHSVNFGGELTIYLLENDRMYFTYENYIKEFTDIAVPIIRGRSLYAIVLIDTNKDIAYIPKRIKGKYNMEVCHNLFEPNRCVDCNINSLSDNYILSDTVIRNLVILCEYSKNEDTLTATELIRLSNEMEKFVHKDVTLVENTVSYTKSFAINNGVLINRNKVRVIEFEYYDGWIYYYRWIDTYNMNKLIIELYKSQDNSTVEYKYSKMTYTKIGQIRKVIVNTLPNGEININDEPSELKVTSLMCLI